MNQLKEKLEKVILKHFPRSSIHGLNNTVIPAKKLENVKALHNIKDETVLFIYDATLFGSAKDGMVLTERGIYWRQVLDSPESLDYKDLIESTANKDLRAKAIFILDQDKEVEIKEIYYKLICDIRSELIITSIIYETYYKSALSRAEEILTRLLSIGEFNQIISWLRTYEGLFLKPKHKSVKLREISFQAYLKSHMFPKAGEQLEFIEDKNPKFYRKAVPLLELAIKEADFESLSQEMLKAIEEENFELAFSLVEDQKGLNIRQEFEIEKIKNATEQSKRETLRKYLEKLNTLLEEEKLVEADRVVGQIYKIEPSYPLEREKVLLTIYKYDLKKAKEEITQVVDPRLRLELEGFFQKTLKMLHEKIRKAVRNKQYDVFEKRPDIWNYTDEYGMCALYYFALEADIEGILKALDHKEILLMPANIFGHNFVDLIGFACDPNLGNKKENPLEILKKIKSKIDLKQIDDRINFLETGQEGNFFSYALSQEDRLSELNEKLISTEHFKYIILEIENQTNNNVDKIIRHTFAMELEDMESYPKKDEFETSEAYKKRSKAFKKQYLDRTDFIAEYKRQNQPMVEGISKLLADKKNCFIPRISALVEYKGKELEALKALETQEDVLGLLNLYFPIKKEGLMVEIGAYDADREVFLMRVDGKTEEMPMPLSIAREFRKTFNEMEFVRLRMIKDGKIICGTVPRYSSRVKW